MVGTKINRWHMELDISGPAASIIRGQFVRSRLVSMTSAELPRRSTRAAEDDYKGRNPQKDPTESFTYHLKRASSHSCVWES